MQNLQSMRRPFLPHGSRLVRRLTVLDLLGPTAAYHPALRIPAFYWWFRCRILCRLRSRKGRKISLRAQIGLLLKLSVFLTKTSPSTSASAASSTSTPPPSTSPASILMPLIHFQIILFP